MALPFGTINRSSQVYDKTEVDALLSEEQQQIGNNKDRIDQIEEALDDILLENDIVGSNQ